MRGRARPELNSIRATKHSGGLSGCLGRRRHRVVNGLFLAVFVRLSSGFRSGLFFLLLFLGQLSLAFLVSVIGSGQNNLSVKGLETGQGLDRSKTASA